MFSLEEKEFAFVNEKYFLMSFRVNISENKHK